MLHRTVKPTIKAQASVKPTPVVKPVTGLVGGASTFVAVAPAFADEASSAAASPVDNAVDAIIGGIQAAGDFVKSSAEVVGSGVEIVKQGVDVAAPVVQKGVDVVSPFVSQAYDAASSAVKSSLPSLDAAIKSSGLPVKETADAVSDATFTVVKAATPVVSKTADFLTTADPVTLGEVGLGLVALAVLAPALGDVFRGYAGDLTAAAAQDKVVNGEAVLVDIRSAKEKEGSGLPDLPSSAGSKVFEVEFAATEDRRLRSSLKDPSGLEVQVTALQIASLKKVSKGSTIILLDRYGSAQNVAKALGGLGFSKVYVITGGFDGRGGWVSSKLQIKPAATAVSAPFAVGTSFTRKSLPAPKN